MTINLAMSPLTVQVIYSFQIFMSDFIEVLNMNGVVLYNFFLDTLYLVFDLLDNRNILILLSNMNECILTC